MSDPIPTAVLPSLVQRMRFLDFVQRVARADVEQAASALGGIDALVAGRRGSMPFGPVGAAASLKFGSPLSPRGSGAPALTTATRNRIKSGAALTAEGAKSPALSPDGVASRHAEGRTSLGRSGSAISQLKRGHHGRGQRGEQDVEVTAGPGATQHVHVIQYPSHPQPGPYAGYADENVRPELGAQAAPVRLTPAALSAAASRAAHEAATQVLNQMKQHQEPLHHQRPVDADDLLRSDRHHAATPPPPQDLHRTVPPGAARPHGPVPRSPTPSGSRAGYADAGPAAAPLAHGLANREEAIAAAAAALAQTLGFSVEERHGAQQRATFGDGRHTGTNTSFSGRKTPEAGAGQPHLQPQGSVTTSRVPPLAGLGAVAGSALDLTSQSGAAGSARSWPAAVPTPRHADGGADDTARSGSQQQQQQQQQAASTSDAAAAAAAAARMLSQQLDAALSGFDFSAGRAEAVGEAVGESHRGAAPLATGAFTRGVRMMVPPQAGTDNGAASNDKNVYNRAAAFLDAWLGRHDAVVAEVVEPHLRDLANVHEHPAVGGVPTERVTGLPQTTLDSGRAFVDEAAVAPPPHAQQQPQLRRPPGPRALARARRVTLPAGYVRDAVRKGAHVCRQRVAAQDALWNTSGTTPIVFAESLAEEILMRLVGQVGAEIASVCDAVADGYWEFEGAGITANCSADPGSAAAANSDANVHRAEALAAPAAMRAAAARRGGSKPVVSIAANGTSADDVVRIV